MDLLWTQIIMGLVAGGIFAAYAIGLTVTFGIIDIINFAHGGFVLVGAYCTVVLVNMGVSFPVAVLISFAVVYLLASLAERGLFRQTLSNPINGLIISVGLLAIIQNTALGLFGTRVRTIDPWSFDTVSILGISVSEQRLMVGLLGFAAVVAYWGVIRFTRFGLQTRALADNREVASLMGMNVGRVVNINFAVGAGVAAVAGALMATIQPVTAFSAEEPTMIAFMVIIIGTMGSIPGVLVAGILLGVATNLGLAFISPSYALVYQFGLVALVLILKPEGLLARKVVSERP
ncbi:branched-chain amino acid ABC transporter permease [Variovorax paradoxus]|nr:branched-chain amino acid ABC transporter permease [Variovorax paradoxus]MBT2301961.1 branched-chain amino acid ABC transporter permease [Variovorax paradoxus]